MIFLLRETLDTVMQPDGAYRHPTKLDKYKAHRFYQSIGTHIVVVYVDNGENGYIRTAYTDSYPLSGVQGWRKVGGLNR
jgi:hypothetical protein